MCTPEAFWKTWDGLPWARKLEAAGITFEVEQTQDGMLALVADNIHRIPGQ
jgi:hypothetical protein